MGARCYQVRKERCLAVKLAFRGERSVGTTTAIRSVVSPAPDGCLLVGMNYRNQWQIAPDRAAPETARGSRLAFCENCRACTLSVRSGDAAASSLGRQSGSIPQLMEVLPRASGMRRFGCKSRTKRQQIRSCPVLQLDYTPHHPKFRQY